MHNIALKIFSVFMNTSIPGIGLLVLGYKKQAIIVQFTLIALVAIICWSRAIFTVPGLSILLASILAIYITSTFLCIRLKVQSEHFNRQRILRHTLTVFLFMILFSSILVAGFMYKDRLFGIHLFFVPSNSMTPTLLPGDFILIDTWLYQSQEPLIGDVVVFTLPGDKRFLVKRISPWPDTIVAKIGDKFFMRGDNQKTSRDSRFFGGVESSRIVGKVKIVLVSITATHQLRGLRMIKSM